MIFKLCKIGVFLTFFVCSSLALFGQEISLSAGLTIASQAYNKLLFQPTVQGQHNIISGFIRVGYEYKINNKWGLELSVQHTEKGYKYKGINIGTPNKTYDLLYEYRLNYIEVPLLVKLKGKKLGCKFGPIVSYLYQANYRYVDKTTLNQNGVVSVYPSSYFGPYPFNRYQKFDFGLMLGIDVKLTNNIVLMLETTKHFVRTDFFAKQRGYNDVMYQQVYLLGIKYKLIGK